MFATELIEHGVRFILSLHLYGVVLSLAPRLHGTLALVELELESIG